MVKHRIPTSEDIVYMKQGVPVVRPKHNIRRQKKQFTDAQHRFMIPTHARTVLWKVLTKVCRYMFADIEPGHDARMTFMSLNKFLNGLHYVYLTKEEIAEGTLVALPVQISRGNLTAIEQEMQEQRVVTSLNLKDLHIDATTTIGALSRAVVDNNNGYSYTDSLSFIALYQKSYPDNEGRTHWYVTLEEATIPLRPDDERVLHQVVKPEYFSQKDHFLASEALPAGCFAFLHEGVDDHENRVFSTQKLLNNNEVLLAELSSDERYELAVESYGGAKSCFADPKS